MNPSITLLLVGATGRVGAHVAHRILDRGIKLRILVRSESINTPQKKVLLDTLIKRGASIVEGNLLHSESLKRAVEDIDVIISTVQGGEKLIVDGQATLAEAGKNAGARRIFPSTFSSELFAVKTNDIHVVENPIFKIRRKAAQAIAATYLPATYLMNGTFMHSMLKSPVLSPFKRQEKVFEYWGTGNRAAAYTALSDAVNYLIEAALDTDPPEHLRVAGDILTMKEMKRDYEKVTGQILRERCLGTLTDFSNKIEQIKETSDSSVEYVFHQIRYAMDSGAGNLEHLNNQLYPSIKPKSFRSMVKHCVP